ncbi:MAG: phospholipid carrier-dependent glycosyltransferase [Thermosynechococcaceae cyanobacterium MS004]|nr:phospholipid carrier-dependent glycosyltransferase [Thermosynechococcaceae cyanobacterium MS004]
MLNYLKAHFNRAWLLNFGGSIGVPIIFFLVVYGLMPVSDTLQFDPDEGIELAKVLLYRQGYTLYDQIWNDQPPLLTILLAHWLGVWGQSITAARLLILGFAAVLVGAFYSTLRLNLRSRYALAGTFGLCLTFGFLRLSVSVMRGLPALALAMLAVYWLLLGQSQRQANSSSSEDFRRRGWWGWIAASGVCFGLSLQIKFVTLLLVPAYLAQLLGLENVFGLGKIRRDRGPIYLIHRTAPYRIILPVALWSLCGGLTFVITGLLTDAFHPAQLIDTHLAASQATLQREPSWLRLVMFLAQDFDYSALAGMGIWLLLRCKPAHIPTFPLYWLITVLLVLSFHQPLWDHYSLMVLIPVVWLATVALAQLGQTGLTLKPWKRSTCSKTGVVLVMLAIALIPVKLGINAVINQQLVQASRQQAPVIAALMRHQAQTRWLFTDLPIASFYTNLKVLPELAVFSTKRIESGNLSNAVLLHLLQTAQPEQVLLGRYPKIQSALQPYLAAHYVRQYQQGQISLYVLKSLVETRLSMIPAVPTARPPAL